MYDLKISCFRPGVVDVTRGVGSVTVGGVTVGSVTVGSVTVMLFADNIGFDPNQTDLY